METELRGREYWENSKERERIFSKNYELLKKYTFEIKENCSKIGLNEMSYRTLPFIKKEKNIHPWERFGKVVKGKIENSDYEERKAIKKIAANYILISKVLESERLRDVGLGLIDKLFLDY